MCCSLLICRLFTDDLCYEEDCDIAITSGSTDQKTGKKKVNFHIGFYQILPEMFGVVYACVGPKDIDEQQPTGLNVRKGKSIQLIPQFLGQC